MHSNSLLILSMFALTGFGHVIGDAMLVARAKGGDTRPDLESNCNDSALTSFCNAVLPSGAPSGLPNESMTGAGPHGHPTGAAPSGPAPTGAAPSGLPTGAGPDGPAPTGDLPSGKPDGNKPSGVRPSGPPPSGTAKGHGGPGGPGGPRPTLSAECESTLKAAHTSICNAYKTSLDSACALVKTEFAKVKDAGCAPPSAAPSGFSTVVRT